jgi:hypothetical protein
MLLAALPVSKEYCRAAGGCGDGDGDGDGDGTLLQAAALVLTIMPGSGAVLLYVTSRSIAASVEPDAAAAMQTHKVNRQPE